MPAAEFVAEFEKRYGEAQQHGLQLNTVMLTLQLLESAMLTESQESWVLQTCAGDLTQYQTIRRAIRRMPQLDPRHQDASAWPVNPDQSWNSASDQSWNSGPGHRGSSSSYSQNPFQDHHLNAAPVEPYQEPTLAANLHENQQDYYPGFDEDDDSDSDDDYCSTCPSNEDQDTAHALVTAFAITHHRKQAFRKKNGGKRFYRKGFRRKKNTWVADNMRNASDEVPKGWDPQRWLARSKCPGCGSRFHRNCGGKGKAYALHRKKGKRKGDHGKGGGKDKGGGFKGGGGGKGTGFGVFMLTAASLLNGAASYLTCPPCQIDVCQIENPNSLMLHDFSHSHPMSEMLELKWSKAMMRTKLFPQ